MLLAGATIDEIASRLIRSGLFKKDFDSAVNRVRNHLNHLRKEAHNVTLVRDRNGIWRFAGKVELVEGGDFAKNTFYNPDSLESVGTITAEVTTFEQDIDDIKI